MKVYVLTEIGKELASTPVSNPTVARKILYWMRRHHDRTSDDQLENYVEPNRGELQVAINSLVRSKAIVSIRG